LLAIDYLATVENGAAWTDLRSLLLDVLRERLRGVETDGDPSDGQLHRLASSFPGYLVSYLEMRFSKKKLDQSRFERLFESLDTVHWLNLEESQIVDTLIRLVGLQDKLDLSKENELNTLEEKLEEALKRNPKVNRQPSKLESLLVTRSEQYKNSGFRAAQS